MVGETCCLPSSVRHSETSAHAYRRTWQSGAAVRSLRPSTDRIPILPQSPLPKVPQPDARRVAARSSDGDSAGSVLSRGLHAPSPMGASGTPTPPGRLRNLVSCRGRIPSCNGCRSKTSRRTDWLSRRSTHVVTTTGGPPAYPLCRARRRVVCRWAKVDQTSQEEVFLAGEAARPPISR